MIKIKVPASSANLGPGFDSIGLAVNRYLEIEAKPAEQWSFTHVTEDLKSLPKDNTHYIAMMVHHFCSIYHVEPFAMDITMSSNIPLARGLGSSGTALIASLLLVNSYRNLGLSSDDMIEQLSAIEGHPDNVVPSLLGGVTAGYSSQDKCYYQSLPPIEWPLFAIIPDYELETSIARAALPQQFDYSEAVAAGAIGNVLVAALAAKNYELAGQMMVQDKYHEPFRKSSIKDFEYVQSQIGDKGFVVISGAGSTMLLMIRPEHEKEIQNMNFESLQLIPLQVDLDGATVTIS